MRRIILAFGLALVVGWLVITNPLNVSAKPLTSFPTDPTADIAWSVDVR